MRLFAVCLSLLGFFTAPLVAVAQPSAVAVAPCDEYFGRTNESVLEIRNRLTAFALKTDKDIQSAGSLGWLDTLEDAVLDWQHKYPADPWVVDAMAHLLESYARAGASNDPHAVALLQMLVARYPLAAATSQALMAVGKASAAARSAPAATVVASP